ncbi:hypothetical protein BDZ97DRAFT_1795374 [Flammula alnicola]|nr:hypothetical protein BDZ97DRAFT_1795374 [Flammula alnicola]
MSAEQYTHVEQDPQDPPGGNELPTYDDLANQNGPNSRFGRWRGWIEKRAAERYADITPEERSRRRERGWDISSHDQEDFETVPVIRNEPPTPSPSNLPLHIQTSSLSIEDSPPQTRDDTSTITGPLPFLSQVIEPTHLKINHFGSHRMLLVGHDEGLSVLDIDYTKGPDEAQCRPMWRGETVFQMSILEAEDHGNGSHKGSKPLDLHKMSNWQVPSTPSKKHRAHGSIARGIKSLVDSPPPFPPAEITSSSHQTFLSPTIGTGPNFAKGHPPSERGSPPSRRNSLKDLPLKWATDFVPLAVPGSRLVGATVVAFATWSDESRKSRTGGQLLAIATKSNILLYETPKGERAYRFVKEFYTPLQPRQITFIQQSVTEVRSPVESSSSGRFHSHSHKRSDSGSTLRGVMNTASSLFVVFDKKAGLIRLADSAVGEVELGEDGGPQPPGNLFPRDTYSSTISSSTLRQRARLSFDIRESASKWTLPVRCNLPVPGQPGVMQPVHILTRGKRTHILPCPLPPRSSVPPMHAVFWKSHPTYVSSRVIFADGDSIDEPPLLQLVAFSENGIEIQEMGVSFMNIKGKGRAFPDEMLRAEEDLGEAGFLSVGGNWDRLEQIYGCQPMPSAASVFSVDSMDSTDILARMKREEGIYGWCRKGMEDWRVFWVGGNQGFDDSASDTYNPGGMYG